MWGGSKEARSVKVSWSAGKKKGGEERDVRRREGEKRGQERMNNIKKDIRKAFQRDQPFSAPSMLPASAGGVSRQGHHPTLACAQPFQGSCLWGDVTLLPTTPLS